MTDLDPELAATLRASADNRIRQQIAQAALRRQAEADTRAEFAVRRTYAKAQLHRTRRALIAHHQEKTMSSTIQQAHADTLAQLPKQCRDCAATGDTYLAYIAGVGDALYCEHCTEHPNHVHSDQCPGGSQ